MLHRHDHRRHRLAGKENLAGAIDNDLLGRRQSGFNHTQAIDQRSQRDVSTLRGIALANHVHVATILVGEQGLLMDQQGIGASGTEQAHARKQAGRKHTFRIGQQRTRADGAGRRIQRVVDEDDFALVGIALVVG